MKFYITTLTFLYLFVVSLFGQKPAPRQYMQKNWTIEAKDIDASRYFGETVANGMIGLVSSPDPMKVKDVVLNGVFDNYQRGRVENILKVFNHVNLQLVVDEKWANSKNIKNYQQALDMRNAVLVTTFDFENTKVVHKMRSLRQLPFSSLIEVEITPKKNIDLQIRNDIESPDHLRDVRNLFAQINRPHVVIPLQTSVAQSPTGRHTVAASTSFIFEEDMHDQPEVIHEDWDFNRHLAYFEKKLKAGQTYRFGLVGSACATEHVADPLNEAERLTIYAALEGMDRLVKFHNQAWDKLWESDIIIKGNDADQLAMRNCLYHLYAFVREGSGYSMSPMGLSGLGYNGHVFWDTEIWMYPPLLILQPQIARSIIDYRINRVEAARTNAWMHGFKGAMFPWESAADGSEQTPVWALTGPFQHHISADIAWAAWKYYQVTGDKAWLKEKGYPLMKEVAIFLCSRVERNGKGSYDIKNVIGANEYEENIDNNAFTNAVAKLALQYTHQAAEILGEQPDSDWLHVAENIPILEFKDGVTRENATYDGVTIKQADVNLLAHPLNFYTDEKKIEKDLDYYAPRYDLNGPAMGFCILSTLYSWQGKMDKAYDFFERSFRPNEVPPFGVISETRNGNNPYFITGAGGALQAAMFGFGGLKITDEGVIETKQNLPKEWDSLEVKGYFKKQ